MTDQPQVQYAFRTDVGMRRAANQDSVVIRLSNEYQEWNECGHLFVVADGMGGHSVGDLASRIAVDSLPIAYFKVDADSIPDRLRSAIIAANRSISDKARENPEFADMGTTCSTLVLSTAGAFVGHVGDSRVYRVRNGYIQQLTFDHSLQWEMVRQGRATIENVDMLHPRNVITRCLGPDQNVPIDIEGPFQVLPEDRFVICSDGLTGHMSDSEIGAIANSMPPADAARLLINLANCRGGTDNVTVVVARVESFPTQTGKFVDSPMEFVAAKTTEPSATPSGSIANRISMSLFLLLGVSGLGLLALGEVQYGLWLICPALILGFLSMIASTNRQVAESSALADTAEFETAGIPGLQPLEGSRPAANSPYRTAPAEIDRGFLELLAQAQSELTTAARENGWKADFDSLANMNRQALAATKANKLEQCVQIRAQAIDDLMKELYVHSRHG